MKSRRMRRARQGLCGLAMVGIILSVGGCSPELLIGGAIIAPVLYAHMNKDSLPRRGDASPHRSGWPYPNGTRVVRAYKIEDPRGSKAEPQDWTPPALLIEEGAQAYWELRWDDAVRTLRRAISMEACTPSQLGQAHFILGAIVYQRGDAKSAQGHFVEAHRCDRQLEPSPELFPPPLIAFFRRVTKYSED